MKIVFLKKSSDFFSCFVLAKFSQLGDCRCGNNSPPAEGRATKWRGGFLDTPATTRQDGSVVPLPDGAELKGRAGGELKGTQNA